MSERQRADHDVHDVRTHDEGAVRVLAIDRPARRNAVTPGTMARLVAALDAAEADDAVGAVVLTGVDGHFGAGGDAHAVLETVEDPRPERVARFLRPFHEFVHRVWTSPLPVVGAVSGVAYGGGFNLALACDLVVCSADARFCMVFLRRGIIPDVGGGYLLPRLVGMQRAKELMLLTPEIDAARAYELGLVNAVEPDADAALARATALATQLAAGPRRAIALTKKLLNDSTTGDFRSSLDREATLQASAMAHEDAHEGFAGFLSRRSSEKEKRDR